ncbi:MAG: phage tail tape measure protein [Trichloromonadaceae bacterium]
MAGELGSLLVDIGASTARLERDLAKARSDITNWAGGVTSTVKGIGVALAGAFTVGSVVQSLKANLDLADSMAKLSQSVGVSVENLTAYRHAANLSGVSIETVGKGLGLLSRKMVEAAEGTGEGYKAFQTLGLSATDAAGQLLDSDKALEQIADRFAKMPDGPQKTAAAMDLFGKSGKDLIPLLNGGSAGLAQMRDEAQRLGLTFDTNTAKAAERVNDNMARVQASFTGLATKTAVGLIPTLDNLAAMMAGARSETENMTLVSDSLAAGLKLMASGGVVVGEVFKSVGSYLGAFAASFEALVAGDFRRAYNVLTIGGQDIADSVRGSLGTIDKIWTGTASAVVAVSANIIAGLEPVVGAHKKVAESVKSLTQEYIKLGNAVGADSWLTKDREKWEVHSRGLDVAIQMEQETAEMSKGIYIDRDDFWLIKEREKWDVHSRGLDAMVDTEAGAYEQMKNAVAGWAANFSGTLADMVWGAENSFNDILTSFGKMITQMMIQKSVVEPMLANFSLVPNAKGNVYNSAGLSAYSGSVVNSPTLFPFAKGIGLMGEAGPEAIMPLKRGADGTLGVSGGGGGGNITVNLIEAPGKGGQVKRTQEAGGQRLDISVEAIMKRSFAMGAMDSTMLAGYGLGRVGR